MYEYVKQFFPPLPVNDLVTANPKKLQKEIEQMYKTEKKKKKHSRKKYFCNNTYNFL